jgi:hypothetical protein
MVGRTHRNSPFQSNLHEQKQQKILEQTRGIDPWCLLALVEACTQPHAQKERCSRPKEDLYENL